MSTKLCLVSLCGVLAFGQHHGGSGSAHGTYRGAVVPSRHLAFRHRVSRSPGLYPYGLTGGYDYEPDVMLVQPPPPKLIVQAPPREVRSSIHDYTAFAPAAVPTPASEPGEATSFVIALADGSFYSASAVWVQDSVLHYVDGEDHHHEVPLDSVDRQSTRKRNQERKLDLWLPAA